MKILIIHNHYLEQGGEDEVVKAEVKLLVEHGHQVIFYEKSNEYLKKQSFFKNLIFVLFELNFSSSSYKEIKEIIKRERPDIAHVHNVFICISPLVYKALGEEGVPIVQTLHNYRFFCLKGTFFNKGNVCEKCKVRHFFSGVVAKCWRNSFILSWFLARFLYKLGPFIEKIDSYIALSNFSRNKFIKLGLKKEKIYLKSNLLTIPPPTGKKDYNYALFIGRLVDYKGIEILIKAFKIKPVYNLKIIGDGPLRERVRNFVSLYDNVEWLGQLDKNSVFDLIRNSSFVIFPSQCYENMPMVIIESFAFSKPVLASNVGAIKEFVIDGVNGLLFNPDSPEDLASKAAHLFLHEEERVKMGENANRFYREKFDQENNYQVLMDIYREAINSKGVGLNAK